MLKKRKKRNLTGSVLFTWCICYGVLVVLLVVLTGLITVTAQNRLVEEYKEIAVNAQQKAGMRLGEYIDEMQENTIDYVVNSLVNDFGRISVPDKAEYYNLVPLQQFLKNRKLSESWETYLYFRNIDKALSEKTVYSKEAMEKVLGFDAQENDGKSILDTKHYQKILTVLGEEGECENIFFLSSGPIGDANPRVVVIQQMDMRMLDEIMENYSVLEDSVFLLTDENDNVLRRVGDSFLGSRIGSHFTPEESISTIEGESCWTWSVNVGESGWKFVTVLPRSVIVRQTSWIKGIIFPIFFVVFAIGVFLAGWMVWLNYKPLKNLKDTLPVTQKGGNEYQLIRDAIESYKEDYEEIQKLADRQKKQMRNQYIASLLTHGNHAEHGMEEYRSYLEISFKGEYFQVAAIELMNENASESYAKDEALNNLISRIFAEEREKIRCFTILELDKYAILFNYEKEECSSVVEKGMQELVKLLGEYEAGYRLSGVYKGINQLDMAWAEAREALLFEEEEVGREESFEEARKTIQLSASMEELLLRYVKAGNEKEALGILADIFERNTYEGKIHPAVLKCICYDILCGLGKGSTQDALVKTASRELGRIEDTAKMEEAMQSIISRFAKEGAGKTAEKEKGAATIGNILQCVQEHFREYDFNVSKVAEYEGMSVAYLSKLFKQQLGIGMLEYINSIRINYAKELLKDGKVTVTQAANSAGFENLNTFIRLFKKYEGKTPGFYLNEKDESK